MNHSDFKAASSIASVNNTSKHSHRILSDAFKAQVALAAIREDKTLNELSSTYQVHSRMISLWKQSLLQNAEKIFSGPKNEKEQIKKLEKEVEEANALIGEKEREIAF